MGYGLWDHRRVQQNLADKEQQQQMAMWDTWTEGSGMALKDPTEARLTNYKMLRCA